METATNTTEPRASDSGVRAGKRRAHRGFPTPRRSERGVHASQWGALNVRVETTKDRACLGFTLIEALAAAGIMATAILAVAAVFAYSARANLLNEQRTRGIELAASKIEDLRSTSPIQDLPAGGGLDADSAAPGYFEYVEILPSGDLEITSTPGARAYLRLWRIGGGDPRRIEVAVYARRGGVTGSQVELVRLATLRTRGF